MRSAPASLQARYGIPSSELPWPLRAPNLLSTLHHLTRPDFTPPSTILCLQEVLHAQLLDIHSSLGPGWFYLGVGRDDGKHAGEYAPIFFRPAVWEVLHFETIWLSPTPKVAGSRGWDAASVRILSVAVLMHRESGLRVLAMNTHLDDQGAVSRREAARMIVRIGKAMADEWDLDFSFLVGDLNSEFNGDAYQLLNEEGSGFVDMRRCIGQEDEARRYGNEMTFTGFKDEGDGDGMTRIDFIHLGRGTKTNGHKKGEQKREVEVTVAGYAVLPNKFDEVIYSSDHRAVVGDIVIG